MGGGGGQERLNFKVRVGVNGQIIIHSLRPLKWGFLHSWWQTKGKGRKVEKHVNLFNVKGLGGTSRTLGKIAREMEPLNGQHTKTKTHPSIVTDCTGKVECVGKGVKTQKSIACAFHERREDQRGTEEKRCYCTKGGPNKERKLLG